jgi:hypothetical protein
MASRGRDCCSRPNNAIAIAVLASDTLADATEIVDGIVTAQAGMVTPARAVQVQSQVQTW